MTPLMNAMQKMMSGQTPQVPQMPQMNPVQMVMQRVNEVAQQLQSPQQLVQKFFPDVPAEMQNDPNMIVKHLIDSGRITQQQVDQLRQMFPQR